MTKNSKEQIIIDGVDVSECHFAILPKDSCPAKSRPYARETSCIACKEHNTILNYCKNNPNCYFKQLAQKTRECDIWKNQVLVLDDEAVTVQVTQEQFEEYQKLKQECEGLKEKNALLESQMAFNLSEMGIRLGNEVNRSETLLKELKRFDKIKDEFREILEKLKTENTRYRKALDKIEKILKDEICEECPGKEGCKAGCKEHQCLDIINKTKGRNNE